jgi:hypothetical protein
VIREYCLLMALRASGESAPETDGASKKSARSLVN